ncbi:MAG TPA: DUF3943 domain-containing protein [Candidatus Binatia bacterium]|nr:DUF3943 domain-containing protein [Candidatus Binatia bacterium]
MKPRHFLTIALVFTLVGGSLQAGAGEKEKPVFYALKKSNPGRAFAEAGIVLGVISAYYWIKYANYREDWRYELNWRDQRLRFFTLKAHSFDSNNFKINWGHVYQGTAFYNFFRSNNQSTFAAAANNVLSSLVWEYVSEWREVISINDNICTAIGGLPSGEAVFRLGRHLSLQPGRAARLLGWIVNPIQALNLAFDRRAWEGVTPQIDHPLNRLEFYLGMKYGRPRFDRETAPQFSIGFDTRLMTVPGHGRPGSGQSWEGDTLKSTYAMRFNFHDYAVNEYTILTRVLWCGWVWQRVDAGGGGRHLILGLTSAFELLKNRPFWPYDYQLNVITAERRQTPRPTQFADKFCLVNLLGPAVDLGLQRSKWTLNAEAGATIDFGLVNALALGRYSVDHDLAGAKTTVLGFGYYYAFGATLYGEVGLKTPTLQLALGTRWSSFASINGRDQFQAMVTDNFALADRRLLLHASLRANLPDSPLGLKAGWEYQQRDGRIEAIRARQAEHRFYTGLSWVF